RLAADEQLGGDVLVGLSVARHPCDPRLVRGELTPRLVGTLAGGLRVVQHLSLGALRKRLSTHFHEARMRGSELFACIDAAPASAQPFAVEQMRASEVEGDPTVAQAVDRLAVEVLGERVVAQQRCAAGLNAE